MAWLEAALAAYCAADPDEKCRLTQDIPEPGVAPQRPAVLPEQPGRPVKPELIHPARVPRRRLGSESGRIALLHAVAHIEFNAINLALDAALRFGAMPLEFYRDWISVAKDEARHFQMIAARMGELGATYGDCPAHNGLWEMAEKTVEDPMVRMALVPRVLEARGLDVTPGIIQRLTGVADHASVSVLEVILREEVRHVEIGSCWFRWLCDGRGLEPSETFLDLLRAHMPDRKRGPMNMSARRDAGFSEAELASLGG